MTEPGARGSVRGLLRPIHVIFVLWLALVLASKADAEQIQMSGTFPAADPEAAQLSQLSVQAFSGNGGSYFSSALVSALSTVNLDGRPYFSVVPLSGQSSAAGGQAGIVQGTVTVNSSDANFQRQERRCVQSAGLFKCAQWQDVTLYCTQRAVDVAVSVQITRVADRMIVYSVNKPMHDQFAWCSGETPSKTVDQSFQQISQLVAQQVIQDVSPHRLAYQVRLLEGRDGLSKDAGNKFKAAIKTSEANSTGSCQVWQQLSQTETSSPSLYFDLGVCAELQGDYARAGQYYQQASSLDKEGKREIAEAITRAGNLGRAQVEASQQANQRQAAREEEQRREAEAAQQRQDAAVQAERSRQQAAADQRRRAEAASAKERAQANAASAVAKSARDKRRKDLTAQYGAAVADAILAGEVRKGMSPGAVRAAIGNPSSIDSISAGEEQWHYPGRRIVFSGGRVTYVGS